MRRKSNIELSYLRLAVMEVFEVVTREAESNDSRATAELMGWMSECILT